ncbi:hypothetical protein [Microbulbifer sp. JMSA008]|uniref:hypothetical protein n=1 Tax=Microbulbifer sp. JMSA008 TaxID=3243373 RepID=UPI004039C33C
MLLTEKIKHVLYNHQEQAATKSFFAATKKSTQTGENKLVSTPTNQEKAIFGNSKDNNVKVPRSHKNITSETYKCDNYTLFTHRPTQEQPPLTQ